VDRGGGPRSGGGLVALFVVVALALMVGPGWWPWPEEGPGADLRVEAPACRVVALLRRPVAVALALRVGPGRWPWPGEGPGAGLEMWRPLPVTLGLWRRPEGEALGGV
jgi:hypothetical protein